MVQSGFGAPALACCGFSGSGKTTLLESIVPRLRRWGLAVAVIKHDAHGIRIDREGKDSDRLFRAGATVLLEGPDEAAARWHRDGAPDLSRALELLGSAHDLVLVEGHKRTALPKLWLLGPDGAAPPDDVGEILGVLPWNTDRNDVAFDLVTELVAGAWRERRIRAGILVGGRSRRMGSPKQLLEVDGEALIHRVIDGLGAGFERPVFLGSGQVPASAAGHRWVPDVPGVVGPVAGFLAAMRWDPTASWLMVACDQLSITPEAVAWLLECRRPGRWAIMPRLDGGPVEPFLAVYEPQARALFEDLVKTGKLGPWRLVDHPRVLDPVPPPELERCWSNVNTPADLESISG